MTASLPRKSDIEEVLLRAPSDAVALAAHAAFVAVGFRLVGLGEEHRIQVEGEGESTDRSSETTVSSETTIARLPAEWNAQNAQAGSYAFRYKHSQSSMEFLLKISRMGSKAIIMGMALGDDRTASTEVKLQDYISEGNLPLLAEPSTSSPDADADAPSAALPRRLVDIFITAGRLSDFGSLMRVHLIQKLIPSLHKEGYEETTPSTATSTTSSSSTSTRTIPPSRSDPRPSHDPLRDDRDAPARPSPFHPAYDPLRHPRRPLPEPYIDFDDEHELLRPRPGPGTHPLGGPRLGDRDLYPAGLGPYDPLRGPGFAPGGGGGMHPTFDDPLFAGPRGPYSPPGARYDPVGPGMPGARHPRGAGMGGRPPNPFGGFGGGDFI
ncbi:hypothetical protein MRB53_040778 [Persea americana]|nr:hypothetical protein MRB53_040778 [Persea americana]